MSLHHVYTGILHERKSRMRVKQFWLGDILAGNINVHPRLLTSMRLIRMCENIFSKTKMLQFLNITNICYFEKKLQNKIKLPNDEVLTGIIN